jgi:hypothetical protein
VPADPTDADRATARELALLARSGVGGPRLREDAIAQALADERERARAPFLALADQFAEREDAASIWSAVARLIRAAAQEDPK